ncbi:MAG TPA: hypothetical protein VK654_14605 [Nitrospirota bacterium]|nr:hypothetical protein [Nitrospirota bacterium]
MKNVAMALLTAALLASSAAWAQQKDAIELKTSAQVEVVKKNEKGDKTVTFVDAAKESKVPGDVVLFTTTYTNTGKQPADAVVITNPVPEHTVYIAESAAGANTRIDFSVDGGKTYAAPDKLTLKDKNNITRKAAAADYTHIRWTLTKSLPAGGSGSVSYKAKIK